MISSSGLPSPQLIKTLLAFPISNRRDVLAGSNNDVSMFTLKESGLVRAESATSYVCETFKSSSDIVTVAPAGMITSGTLNSTELPTPFETVNTPVDGVIFNSFVVVKVNG